jgi:hypothetical protein
MSTDGVEITEVDYLPLRVGLNNVTQDFFDEKFGSACTKWGRHKINTAGFGTKQEFTLYRMGSLQKSEIPQ